MTHAPRRTKQDDRLPHNKELERANLVHILTWPEYLPEMRALLRPKDFHDYFHHQVWTAILAAHDAGAPLDGTFICAVRARLSGAIPEMPTELIGSTLGKLIQP